MRAKPIAIDIYCGLGGWAEGFLAEGYECIGFDIERHDYGTGGYPGQLVLQDALTLHGSQFRNAACIVCSPPCQEYSYMSMPWSRAKAKAAAIRADETGEAKRKLTALFDACFRIQREASEAAGRHIPMVVENVRGAQPWVGRAPWNYGSFFLWGDVPALMPFAWRARKKPGTWSSDGHQITGKCTPAFNGASHESNQLNHAGLKVPGMNFHEHEKTGKPGRSFQSAAVDGLKVPGNKLSENGFTIPVARAIDKSLRPKDWKLDSEARRQHLSFSRKAASAAIAKIPFELSRWIAHCFKPVDSERAA